MGAVQNRTAPTRFLSENLRLDDGRPRGNPQAVVGSDAVCARSSPEESPVERALQPHRPSSEPERSVAERTNEIRAEAVEENAVDSVFRCRDTRTADWEIRKTSNRTAADEIPKAAFATGPKSIWPRRQTYA